MSRTFVCALLALTLQGLAHAAEAIKPVPAGIVVDSLGKKVGRIYINQMLMYINQLPIYVPLQPDPDQRKLRPATFGTFGYSQPDCVGTPQLIQDIGWTMGSIVAAGEIPEGQSDYVVYVGVNASSSDQNFQSFRQVGNVCVDGSILAPAVPIGQTFPLATTFIPPYTIK